MIKAQTTETNYLPDALNVPRKSHAKYELKTSKDKGVFEVLL